MVGGEEGVEGGVPTVLFENSVAEFDVVEITKGFPGAFGRDLIKVDIDVDFFTPFDKGWAEERYVSR